MGEEFRGRAWRLWLRGRRIDDGGGRNELLKGAWCVGGRDGGGSWGREGGLGEGEKESEERRTIIGLEETKDRAVYCAIPLNKTNGKTVYLRFIY